MTPLEKVSKKINEEAEKPDEEPKKEVYIQKYSNGRLLETILIAGHPCFLMTGKDGKITLAAQIELEDRILKPLEASMYLNKPYSFDSKEELQAFIDSAQKASIDSLYRDIKKIWQKYIDADHDHLTICSADTLYTYFQDRLGLTHYLFFIGNNGTGKSNNLRVFQQLAYRNMTSTDITPANIYRFLGNEEEAQGTICEDEADSIDESTEKMRIYKEGYTATGSKVMRSDSTNYGVKQQAFYAFCFKAFAAERLPDSRTAKGFNDRCIEIQCYPGLPKYDIVEVVNPAGVEDYQDLSDELTEMRNLLLVYRMLHYFEPIQKVKLNIDGRENQLFSPLIRIFHGTETEKELLSVISKYLSERREKNANSWYAYLYRTIKELVVRHEKTELEFSQIWQAVTDGIAGTFKTESLQTYESEEFGSISRKGVSETLMQVFGAKQSLNRRESRKLIFDKSKLDQQSKYYDIEIQVKVVTDVTDVTVSEGAVGMEKYYDKKQMITTEEESNNCPIVPTSSKNLSHLSQPSQELKEDRVN